MIALDFEAHDRRVIEDLENHIAAIDVQLAEAKAKNEKLEKQRDYWQSQHDERTRQLGDAATPPTPKVTESHWAVVQKGYEEWAAKPHNKKWVKRLDGTPIPNDLIVCIVSALTAAQENGQ